MAVDGEWHTISNSGGSSTSSSRSAVHGLVVLSKLRHLKCLGLKSLGSSTPARGYARVADLADLAPNLELLHLGYVAYPNTDELVITEHSGLSKLRELRVVHQQGKPIHPRWYQFFWNWNHDDMGRLPSFEASLVYWEYDAEYSHRLLNAEYDSDGWDDEWNEWDERDWEIGIPLPFEGARDDDDTHFLKAGQFCFRPDAKRLAQRRQRRRRVHKGWRQQRVKDKGDVKAKNAGRKVVDLD